MAEYYLGVDIGDGETSVAVLSEQAVAPVMADIGYKNRSILSAVGDDPEGKPVIGENVLLMNKVTNRRVRFKSRFLTGEANNDILRFAQGLADALEKYSGLMAEENTLHICIGCPTGAKWTAKKRAEYANLIRYALPIVEQPVGESRAAFLYTHYSGNINVPKQMLGGNVLVVDMGSSTTDLAYVVAGRQEKMDVLGAEHLGGGLIDQAILARCVARNEKAAQIQDLFERQPSVRHSCEISARMIKERYFTAKDAGMPFDEVRRETLFYGKTRAEHTTLTITADDEMMDAILHEPMPALFKGEQGRAFIETLDELLDAAAEHTKSAPPELIIITGGASRMGFVREHIAQHFPHATLGACGEPEFSIAKGLAFACRVDRRMERYRAQIRELTDDVLFEAAIDQDLPSLVDALCHDIAPAYVDHVFMPVIREFDGKKKELEAELERRSKDYFDSEALKEIVADALHAWMQGALSGVKEKINEISAVYRIDPAKIPVPDAAKIHISIPELPVGFLARALMSLPGLGGMIAGLMRRRYVAAAEENLEETMNKRSSVFYTELRAELKRSIREDIDRRAKEVEIPVV